jgi:hypothetical protein
MKGRGGARARAGRKAGGKNRSTIERAALAERIISEQQGKPGRKLGKELLEDFALMFASLAASFQPAGTGPNGSVTPDDVREWATTSHEPLFEKYAKLAAKCANDFADFQSPRMGTLQAPAPAPENQGQVRKKFTIAIFDHQGRPAPRHISVKPASKSDTNNGS